MATEQSIREEIRQWIANSAEDKTVEVRDDTQLIEQKLLTSLTIVELILLIELLTEKQVDASTLEVGDFESINSIIDRFFNNDS